jgi:glycosyltransferase involved in cell wall biosynthesis
VKLSVIIPVYNRAELIKSAVESVLSSGLDDFELIVVDDGSTDGTAEAVQELGPSVQYIRQTNAGPSSARNRGIAASRGRYVAFLDSDDRWYHGAVPTLLEQLDKHGEIPVIFGDARMGSPGAGFVSLVRTFGGNAFENLPSREIEPGVRFLERASSFRQLLRRNFVFLGSLVVRREVVDRVGGFDPSLFHAEDWELCLRIALQYGFCYCDRFPVAVYNQHCSTSLTKNQDGMNAGFCKALERLLEQPELTTEQRLHVIFHLKRCKFGYAYPAYDRGDYDEAGERFLDCLRSGFAWKPFFYWLACQSPSPILKRARLLKQKCSG